MFDFILFFAFSLLISLIFVSNIEKEGSVTKAQRYTPNLNYLFLAEIFFFILYGIMKPENFPKFLPLFLHISLYFSLMVLALPYLRKYFSTRILVVLWILPYFMYILTNGYFSWITNLIIIPVSSELLNVFYYINVIGATCVIGIEILNHLRYRKWLLKDAYTITNQNVLSIFEDELNKANFRYKKYDLVVSKKAQTPLSIGLFGLTTKIVLPEKNYTNEELSLIFRHELVHIGKGDIHSKLFLLFWCAICWYNPVVWIAKRKCFEDIELSCDETVLLHEDGETKKLYAKLILSTVARQTGFTTCLSTNAKGLKYRLENILTTKKKNMGYLLVAIVTFIMMVSYGHVSLAYDFKDLNQFIDDKPVLNVSYFGEGEVILVDEEGLMNYLETLKLCKLTLEKRDDWFPKCAFSYNGVYVALSDDWVMVNTSKENTIYYTTTTIDWDILDTFFVYSPRVEIDLYVQDSYMRNYPLEVTSVKDDVNTFYPSNNKNCIEFYEDNLKQIMLSIFTNSNADWIVNVEPENKNKYVIKDSPTLLPIDNCNTNYQIIVSYDGNCEAIYEFGLIIE